MKITIKLNPEQEKYFNEVKYALMDLQNCNNSDVINHILMEALIFEELSAEDMTSYLMNNFKEAYLSILDTERDFGRKFKPCKHENEIQKQRDGLVATYCADCGISLD